MSLYHRARARRPGRPEVLAVVLLVLPAVVGLLWFTQSPYGGWQTAAGTILDCTTRLTHYNAEDNQPKVDATYEYTAGGMQYRGQWSGFWPEADSPNALPAGKLGDLRPGRSVVVFYNPASPQESDLHYTRDDRRLLYALLFPITLFLAAAYAVNVYPMLKRRH